METATIVNIDDRFQVDDVRSLFPGDQLAWSPHNVLAVCTRWSVRFFVSSDRGDASVIPKLHPMVYRSAGSTSALYNMLYGCKWSQKVLPRHYPLSCRLCVQTAGGLVVYGVFRTGNSFISSTHGVKISLVEEEEEGGDTPRSKRIKGTKVRGRKLDPPSPASPTVPWECAVVGYQWTADGNLLVLTPKGLYSIPFDETFADSIEPTEVRVGAPSYALDDKECLGPGIPLCGLEIVRGERTGNLVVVTSPFVWRVLEVRDNAIRCLSVIKVPEVGGILSASCFFCDDPPTASDRNRLEIQCYVALGGQVLRGSFSVSLDSTPVGSHRPARVGWSLDHTFSSSRLKGNPFIRSFHTASVDYRKNTDDIHRVRLIYGLSYQSLFGFSHRGLSCVNLLQSWPNLGQYSVPDSALVGITGFTVHPSCLVSLFSSDDIKAHRLKNPALNVFPQHVLDHTGPLWKILELNGVVDPLEDTDAAFHTLSSRSVTDIFYWEKLCFSEFNIPSFRKYSAAEQSLQRQQLSGDTSHQHRQHYLTLRKEYQLDLFLRWVAETEKEQTCTAVTGWTERPVDSLLWWESLRFLFRLGDYVALHELLMANAVLVLAKKMKYRNCTLSEGEFFQTRNDGPAEVPAALNADGAASFIQLYISEARTKLKLPERDTTYWTFSEGWVNELEIFLSGMSNTESTFPVSDGFPCSLCRAAKSASFDGSFRFVSQHATASGDFAEHTTLFSGKTFAPLAIYSSECLITQCTSCRLSDYATQSFCRVCGGLLA